MNDLQFKQQHLDTKSASFCAAKWYNATIWLGSGQTTSCHHPPAHHVTEKEVIINPAALHNTKQKRDDLRIISHNREILMDWKGHCNFEFIGAVNVFFIYTSITRIS